MALVGVELETLVFEPDVHIHALLLQLARHCSMLYHIRDFVPHYTLIMLYYSFVYSCVNYGITTWGTADQSKEHEIEIKMNYRRTPCVRPHQPRRSTYTAARVLNYDYASHPALS